MRTEDMQELQNDITEKIGEKLPKVPKDQILATVEAAFKEASEKNKILSLTEDEIGLLVSYRRWKSTATSATSAFHYRKPGK